MVGLEHELQHGMVGLEHELQHGVSGMHSGVRALGERVPYAASVFNLYKY
jgi:hypothetical protein